MTSIDIYFHNLGKIAVEKLMELIRGNTIDEITVVPSKIYYRESCGCVNKAYKDINNIFNVSKGNDKLINGFLKNRENFISEIKGVLLTFLSDDTAELLSLDIADKFIEDLKKNINNISLNGHPAQRLPNNINISVSYVEGEAMLLNLDLQGICASTGSACSSGNLEASHVLIATGRSHEQAHGSLRFTLGKWTTEGELIKVLDILPPIVKKLRAMSPLTNG